MKYPRIGPDGRTKYYRPKPFLVWVLHGTACFERRYETAQEANAYVCASYAAGRCPPDWVLLQSRSGFIFDVPEAGQ